MCIFSKVVNDGCISNRVMGSYRWNLYFYFIFKCIAMLQNENNMLPWFTSTHICTVSKMRHNVTTYVGELLVVKTSWIPLSYVGNMLWNAYFMCVYRSLVQRNKQHNQLVQTSAFRSESDAVANAHAAHLRFSLFSLSPSPSLSLSLSLCSLE